MYNNHMEELKLIIAKNLIFLRKKNNLTQADLAEKINYSDNAISRWERGEVTPGIEILKMLSDFYQVEIKDILDENLAKENEDPKEKTTQAVNRVLTVIFSVSVVWFFAVVAYIYLLFLLEINFWQIFILAMPISSGVSLYFNNKWGNRVMSIILSSILEWSVLAFVYLVFLEYNLWLVFLLGIPLQSATITGYFLQPMRKK